MTALVASDLTVALVSGAAGAILVALATFIVGLIVDTIGEGDAIGDVQRFIELSAAGRYSRLPHRPLLSDPDGDASLAINELLAKKEQARQALWGSCDPNRRKRLGIADIDCASELAVKDRDRRLPAPREPQPGSCAPPQSSPFSLRTSDTAKRSSRKSPSSIYRIGEGAALPLRLPH